MAIELNHTIVSAHDKAASADFYARVLGLQRLPDMSHFAVVRVNDTLTLDFDERETIAPVHYAFKVSEDEFDRSFARLQEEGIPYGSGPRQLENRQISRDGGGRRVYFRDPAGHILELLTVD